MRLTILMTLLCVAGCVEGGAYVQPGPAEPECRMGSDGRQACGYHCRIGSDGVSACANTPDGVCAIGSDGRVACSNVAPALRPDQVSVISGPGFSTTIAMPVIGVAPSAAPAPSCHLGSDGQQYCGFNCELGSSGRWFCASSPQGRCALNADGTWSCP